MPVIESSPMKLLQSFGLMLTVDAEEEKKEEEEVVISDVHVSQPQPRSVTPTPTITTPASEKTMSTPVKQSTPVANSPVKVTPLTPTEKTVKDDEQDIKHLFKMLGELTENVKSFTSIMEDIPIMKKGISDLNLQLKSQMSELQKRVLVKEEDILKLKQEMAENTDYMKCHVKPLVRKLEKEGVVEKLNTETLNKIDRNESEINLIKESIANQQKEIPKLELAEEDLVSIAALINKEQKEALETSISDGMQTTASLKQLDAVNKDLLQRVTALEGQSLSEKPSPSTTLNASKISTNSTRIQSKPSKTPSPASNITLDHDLVIIGDSNTKSLSMKTLGRNSFRRRHRYTCYTIEHVQEFLSTAKVVRPPKKVVIHVGTNHIDKDDITTLKQKYQQMVEHAMEVFPKSRVYFSSTFVRKSPDDPLNKLVTQLNEYIFNTCDSTPRISYLSHENISHRDMYDEKHIDNVGYVTFVNNIKHTVLGEVYEEYPSW